MEPEGQLMRDTDMESMHNVCLLGLLGSGFAMIGWLIIVLHFPKMLLRFSYNLVLPLIATPSFFVVLWKRNVMTKCTSGLLEDRDDVTECYCTSFQDQGPHPLIPQRCFAECLQLSISPRMVSAKVLPPPYSQPVYKEEIQG
jgi:hypothetical protein